MSQLNMAALLAQIVTAWVALFLLWQTWRDRRRDQATTIMVAIEKDQQGVQSLTVLNEGERTVKLNAMYQLPMGAKGIPSSEEVIITYLDKPLLAPHARESIPLEGKWDFVASNDAGDPTEAEVILSIIDTRNREWIIDPRQKKPVTGTFWMRGMQLLKIMPVRGNVIVRYHPDRKAVSSPGKANDSGTYSLDAEHEHHHCSR
jgi:hypothetical protein